MTSKFLKIAMTSLSLSVASVAMVAGPMSGTAMAQQGGRGGDGGSSGSGSDPGSVWATMPSPTHATQEEPRRQRLETQSDHCSGFIRRAYTSQGRPFLICEPRR